MFVFSPFGSPPVSAVRRGATTLELLLLCTPRRRIHSGCARRWLALALALDTAQRRTALAVPRSLARSLARRQLARCAAHLPSSKLDAYRAHCAGGPGVIKLVLQGSEYKIDLWRMLQVNAKTGFERQLSRQGPAVPKITAAAPLAASVPRSPAATTKSQFDAALAQRNAPAAAAASPSPRSPLHPAATGGTSPVPVNTQAIHQLLDC